MYAAVHCALFVDCSVLCAACCCLQLLVCPVIDYSFVVCCLLFIVCRVLFVALCLFVAVCLFLKCVMFVAYCCV